MKKISASPLCFNNDTWRRSMCSYLGFQGTVSVSRAPLFDPEWSYKSGKAQRSLTTFRYHYWLMDYFDGLPDLLVLTS